MVNKLKRLTPELKKMVERYKLLNSGKERYSGSIFVVPYETEMYDLSRRFKEKTGVSINVYIWRS